MFTVMVVEDDGNVRKLMRTVLEQSGYQVITAVDGIVALDMLDSNHVDIIILDIMMPRMDGYEFTKTLREGGSEIPILMVTAKESIADKKMGFKLGTDDYMVKPVDEEELILRVAALLRRAKIASEHVLNIGNTVLNYESQTISFNNTTISLPTKEFQLVFLLLSYPNKIFTRRQLMDEIWSLESDTDERTVDVHVNRLRDKFKSNEDFTITTIRGLGYKAVPNEKG